MKTIVSPFKFLDAYEKKDKEIFFGRETDIELLYETAFKTNLMLVYGQSGTGKTSLIQCGLANRFRESDWFDIYIRRRDNIVISLQKEIRGKALTPIEENSSIQKGIQSLYLDFLKPVYLIFDQFEELFILGTREEQQEFFETIAHLLKATGTGSQKAVSSKIIFVMREEYIARLYDFEKMVPGLFDHRIRVEQMHPLKVGEVIRGTVQAFDIKLDEPEETIKGIIDNNRDSKGTIQLPYLQVYLDRLYKEAEAEAIKPLTSIGDKPAVVFSPGLVKRVGKISDVMAFFLDEQTGKVRLSLKEKYPDTPEEFTWQLLNSFVTEEGTNLPLDKEHIYSQFPGREKIIDSCLDDLEKVRILRLSDREKTYEIAHDALARRIDEKRSLEEKTLLKLKKLVKDRFAAYRDTAVFLAKRELNFIEPYEEELKLDKEEINFIAKSRKKISSRRKQFFFITASIIIILIFASFAILKWQVAEEKTKEANANRLTTLSGAKVNEDPTVALRLAEQAWWLLNKNKTVTKFLYDVYVRNNFYRTIAKDAGKIRSVAFSPNGQYILSGSEDRTARLWDLHGKLVKEFKGHKGSINSVAFSSDGQYIITGSWDHTARLWDLKGNQCKEFNPKISVLSVAFSPDGGNILTGLWNNTARLWDLKGNTLQEFKGHKDSINSVAFPPDGETFLTGSRDNTARLWDLKGNTLQEFKGHKDSINSVAFSPDGKTILTGSSDKTAMLWGLNGKTMQVYIGHKDAVTSVTFSPDGQYILTGSKDKIVCLWDAQGNMIQEFRGHKDSVNSVDFSPNGHFIITGSADETACLWDRKESLVREFSGHKDNVTSVAFSPDSKTILTGSWDNTARLWDLKGNTLQEFKGHTNSINSVAFPPDSKTILTGSWDNTARLWDLKGNTLQEFKGHTDSINSVAFPPDGETFLTGSRDNTARLWDLKGNTLQEFKGHKDSINSVAFPPDGKTILTGSSDKTAMLWGLNGNTLQEFKGHTGSINSVAFSPDGKSILSGSADKTARLWDLKGNMLQKFEHKGGITSVALSPYGKSIFTGGWDATACLWDLQGNLIWEFRKDLFSVLTVAISSDGKYVLTGSKDSVARLWRVPHLSLEKSLENFLKKGNLEPLTPEQRKEYGIKD